MKGYLTSFVGLFGEQPGEAPHLERIEIPLIQRDYAQGRSDDKAQEIRSGFLRYLLDAVDTDGSVSLDFVYGKADGGVFHPLDGQQRLTTCFVLLDQLRRRLESFDLPLQVQILPVVQLAAHKRPDQFPVRPCLILQRRYE